ncbi:Mu transposase C-terminal domain-containing protein [[Clostridium] innocuum]|nr:Mu transposase C-terminal domain-containing protein [[Clostridium] innocuum]MCR0259202.1 Mu transposase C-terminal domain-containing protein [[Clostridium] innocuum]
METLTIKELAELEGCSRQNIQKKVSNRIYKTVIVKNSRNKDIHAIPLSELSDELQRKYYEKKGILKTEIQVKNADILEKLTAEEREECVLWERILKEWRVYRERPYFKSKAKADEMFIERVRDELPNINISEDILFRKYKRLVNGDLKGLIDNRGKAKKGHTKIDENVWQVFLSFYLDQAQHPVRKCVKRTEEYVRDKFPELVADFPAYCTFIRHVNSDISDAIATLGREGEKAFDDRCAPYIRRVYDNMESNDYWIGDNHTIDVIVGDGENTFRLYLTAFMDARSGVITGIYLTDAPCAQASIYSLKRGIQKYGIPKNLYLDNGREFLTRDFGGLGHRKKKKDTGKFTPPPILERLGIKMVNAEVRNAKAKTIERRFLDFKNSISRLFSTYTGGNVVEKPEILKVELKKGNIPDKQVFIKEIEEMIEYYMNYEEYNGAVVADKGLRKIDVYQKNLHTLITATDEQLNLMMMRSVRPQKVTRRGVHLDINGARIDYFDNELIMQMLNKQVYFRYDPDDLSKIRIYDLDDRYIMEVKADNTAVLEYGATKEDVKAAMAKTRSLKKAVKEAIKGSIIANIDRNTALELVLKQVEENKKSEIAQANIDLTAIKSAEEQALLYQIPSVDLDKMNENAIKRQGGKDYA